VCLQHVDESAAAGRGVERGDGLGLHAPGGADGRASSGEPHSSL
jgi:hypothetical protein